VYSEKDTTMQKMLLACHCDLLSKFVNYIPKITLSGMPLQLRYHFRLNSGVVLANRYHRHWFKHMFRVKFQFDVDANL